MLNRPTRPQIFMEIAHVIAKRSTCYRLNVGAVITSYDRIISCGYNGVPSGESHCSGNDCPGKNGCNITIHAEENAIEHLPRGVIPHDLYVTHSPCPECISKIREVKIRRVFFSTPYRIIDHLDSLKNTLTQVYQITPAGYIVDWFTKDLVSP